MGGLGLAISGLVRRRGFGWMSLTGSFRSLSPFFILRRGGYGGGVNVEI